MQHEMKRVGTRKRPCVQHVGPHLVPRDKILHRPSIGTRVQLAYTAFVPTKLRSRKVVCKNFSYSAHTMCRIHII